MGRVRRALQGFCLVVALFAALAAPASACLCGADPDADPKDAFRGRAGAVIARLVAVTPVEPQETGQPYSLALDYEFRIIRVFKDRIGDLRRGTRLRMRVNDDCGPGGREGENYGLMLYRSRGWRANNCGTMGPDRMRRLARGAGLARPARC